MLGMTEVERDRASTFTALLGTPTFKEVSTALGLALGLGTGLARGLGGCFGLAAG